MLNILQGFLMKLNGDDVCFVMIALTNPSVWNIRTYHNQINIAEWSDTITNNSFTFAIDDHIYFIIRMKMGGIVKFCMRMI